LQLSIYWAKICIADITNDRRARSSVGARIQRRATQRKDAEPPHKKDSYVDTRNPLGIEPVRTRDEITEKKSKEPHIAALSFGALRLVSGQNTHPN
jgi:hypothetical protein